MFTKMERKYASEIIAWRYPLEYSFYDLDDTYANFEELLNGSYYVKLAENGSVFAMCGFGKAAQISLNEKDLDAYEEGYTDIGLGIAPHSTGQGLGGEFFREVTDFAKERFPDKKLRLTVAAFNRRAISVYEKAGFVYEKIVTEKESETMFYIMIKKE